MEAAIRPAPISRNDAGSGVLAATLSVSIEAGYVALDEVVTMSAGEHVETHPFVLNPGDAEPVGFSNERSFIRSG